MNLRKRFLLIKDKMGHSKKTKIVWGAYTEHNIKTKCGKIFKTTSEQQNDMLEKLHRKKCEICKKEVITRIWEDNIKES